jgi:NAD(P)-dependent dehydrogenase (short-subunit alcohol dehydrogenase family)
MAACSTDELKRQVAELRRDGHEVLGITCDVAEPDQAEAIVARSIATFGRLDAAYNNAGVISPNADLLETPDDELDRVLAVNLCGTWNC